MRILTYIILLIILIFGISFACVNADPVTVHYYIGAHTLPLSMLLVLTFALGCILGLLAGATIYIKQKIRNRGLQQRIDIAEKELTNLRTMPIKDAH